MKIYVIRLPRFIGSLLQGILGKCINNHTGSSKGHA